MSRVSVQLKVHGAAKSPKAAAPARARTPNVERSATTRAKLLKEFREHMLDRMLAEAKP